MKKRLLAWILALMMLITLLPATVLADDAVVSPVDGVYLVSNEKELRYALFKAATDGTVTTIKLTDDITLEMLYAAPNLPTSDVIQDNETGDTFNRYKTGVHPTAEDPTHWNPLVTSQTDEKRAVYGAYYHMGAGDERIARLVVKAGQNVVLDLNSYTIEKNARATHGDWSNTCTDIIGNYGTLTVTDTSTGETKGTIRGRGYISCNGAVLHNYEGAIMTVGAVNIDGNAAGMEKGTGQYVISNEGGTIVIDGANVYDATEKVDASLLHNTAGKMTVKGNTILNHPNTKTINAKGGEVILESATIISDNHAIYAKGGTTSITGDVTIKASTEEGTAGTLTLAGGTITKAENVSLPAPSGSTWIKIGNTETLVKDGSAAVVNGVNYDTLAAAVNAANDGDTITLTKSCSGDGIVFPAGKFTPKGLTVDFNGFTYTVSGTLVGSSGSETIGFQLLRNNKITFKNGTITNDLNCTAGPSSSWWTGTFPAMFLQNYCDLTLQNMTLTPVRDPQITCRVYTMSNNCGDVVIEDSTINTVNGGVAFDVYGGFGNYSDVTVTVKGESKINGKVEVARSNGTQNENKLVIVGGTINGDVTVEDKDKTFVSISGGSINGKLNVEGTSNAKVTISGGSFSEPIGENVASNLNVELKNANGYSYYASLADAIAAAESGDTIKLMADVTQTVTIPADKDLTLDLNGKNITVSSGCAIVNKGKLTVTGNGEVTAEKAAVANFPGAVANLNGGTYSSSNWYVIKNLGTMTIDGPVTVKKPDGSTDTSSLIDNGWYGSADKVAGETVPAQADKAKLTIKSGDFTGEAGSKSCSVVKNDDYGVLVITGGTFNSMNNKGTSNATTILNWNVATISGGTFIGMYPISNGSYDNDADQGILTITGGSFTGKSALLGQGQGGVSGKGTLTITGGTFDAPAFGGFDYTLVISGGTFTMDPTDYLADGYIVKKLDDGTWGVSEKEPEFPSWITALPALDGSKKLPFTDVWRGDWYYDGVRYVFDNDLMNGTSGTVFSPNADTTRGMIVTILARMDGVNTSGTPWYEAGREWAMRNGISDGTNMEGKITREQLAAMLSRYAALKNRDVSAITGISAYADASSVSSWAVNAMRWAVGEGLIQGSNNSLRPQSNATRAEVATILMRFCELLKK